MLFPNWMQNNAYSARLDRQVLRAMFTEGTLSGLATTQRALGANMSVDISAGVGVIYGDDQTDQGAYLATCSVFENIVISAAPGANSRRDLICLRVNDPNAGGPAGNNSAFVVVTGTASASPVLPALPTSAIPLAEVLVASGTVAITDAMITSLRVPARGFSDAPFGVPMAFFGPESLVPADCILLAGQSVSKATYWKIHYYLGSTFGSTSTNFTLPDMRGRSLFGLDNMGGVDAGRLAVANTLGASGGSETVTLTTSNMPPHSHTMNHDHGSSSTGNESNGHGHSIGHTHGPSVLTVNGIPDIVTRLTVMNSGDFVTGSANTATSPPIMNMNSGLASPFAGMAVSYATITPTGSAAGQSFSGGSGDRDTTHTHQFDMPNFTGTTGSEGSGTAVNNMPPYLLCNWIMKF
jgi:microcystin-dependent protein